MTTTIEAFIERFEHNLLSVDSLAAQQTLRESLQTLGHFTTFDRIITPTLEQIGEKWESGEVALSQVYMSGVICEEFLRTNIPPDFSSQAKSAHIAIVTFEDYHALGKRIVHTMLQAHGIDTIDYGHGCRGGRPDKTDSGGQYRPPFTLDLDVSLRPARQTCVRSGSDLYETSLYYRRRSAFSF